MPCLTPVIDIKALLARGHPQFKIKVNTGIPEEAGSRVNMLHFSMTNELDSGAPYFPIQVTL